MRRLTSSILLALASFAVFLTACSTPSTVPTSLSPSPSAPATTANQTHTESSTDPSVGPVSVPEITDSGRYGFGDTFYVAPNGDTFYTGPGGYPGAPDGVAILKATNLPRGYWLLDTDNFLHGIPADN